jgi:molybdenum cofactor biosynthesis enzyme MoaA
MPKLPENACVYPFKAAMLMHGTPATPCCRFHKRFLDSSDIESVDAYDAVFADIRSTMLRNEWHPGCYKCKVDEETKGTSMRTEADEFFSEFTDDAELQYLEITVGRLCNLKCMSCGPEYSHTWDDDALSLGLESPEYIQKLREIQELELADIDVNFLRGLRHIKVTGGEPFLHRQFLDFIVRLAAAGIAPQIDIEIFTNCTWWPKKADYDALLQFNKIHIRPSIDSIGEVNDVLRFPSKWEKVESVLDQWIAMREQYPGKVTIATATTVSVINAPYMYEFMFWARIIKNIDVILQTVYEPNYMSILHYPDWFKDVIRFTVNSQFNETIKPGKIRPARDLIYKLTEHNGVPNEALDVNIFKIKQVLKSRGLNIRQIRKFKDMLELHSPGIDWERGTELRWNSDTKQL